MKNEEWKIWLVCMRDFSAYKANHISHLSLIISHLIENSQFSHIAMQLCTPRLVAIAVSIAASVCRINFQVSFFIAFKIIKLKIFSFCSFFDHRLHRLHWFFCLLQRLSRDYFWFHRLLAQLIATLVAVIEIKSHHSAQLKSVKSV